MLPYAPRTRLHVCGTFKWVKKVLGKINMKCLAEGVRPPCAKKQLQFFLLFILHVSRGTNTILLKDIPWFGVLVMVVESTVKHQAPKFPIGVESGGDLVILLLIITLSIIPCSDRCIISFILAFSLICHPSGTNTVLWHFKVHYKISHKNSF